MKKTAILTWHYYNNFGSALQAYALQKTIEVMGKDVEVLNYQKKEYAGKTLMRCLQRVDFLYKLACVLFNRKRTYNFHAFRKTFLNQTKLCLDREQLAVLAKTYANIVVGSDQIWAPNVFDPTYMLDFIDGDNVTKISYAASVGLNDIPSQLCDTYRNLLSDFDSLAVRETKGQNLLKEKCSIDSKVVLDPTLLVSADQYRMIEKRVDKMEGQYVFCYFLNENHEYRERVVDYAEKKQLKIVGYSVNSNDKRWMNTIDDIGPREFLWMIDNASAVFSDSYHGIIFSLLFHKEFYMFERFKSTDPICQNSRIAQLCNYFNINSRILSKDKRCTDCELYDFGDFEKALKKERKSSIKYLEDALS